MTYFKYNQKAIDHLKECDTKLKCAIERIGEIKRPTVPDLYEGLINSIIAQQISTKAAATVWGRLETLVGTVTPESVGQYGIEDIQKLGMTFRKATYIHEITSKILEGSLSLEAFKTLSDQEVIKALKALPGIGVWTAEMLLIFTLGRMDVLSYDDLGIRRGMMKLYGLTKLERKAFEEYRNLFSPYGSVASLYFWALAAE